MAEIDPAWSALRDEIEQQVALWESAVRLAGQRLTWYQVANPDQVLERATANHSEPSADPFWATSWRSAVGLDRFLDRIDLAGLRVLELGCGSGSVGTSAALRGAQVTMTDAVPLALQLARLNSWPIRERLEYRQLIWGEGQVIDPPFRVILGSDVVYDQVQHASLLQFCQANLAAGGRVYLSEPHRQSGRAFHQRLIASGWTVHNYEVGLDDAKSPIRIFECFRN